MPPANAVVPPQFRARATAPPVSPPPSRCSRPRASGPSTCSGRGFCPPTRRAGWPNFVAELLSPSADPLFSKVAWRAWRRWRCRRWARCWPSSGTGACAAGEPQHAGDRSLARAPVRLAQRAALDSGTRLGGCCSSRAGLGPFAGTLALACTRPVCSAGFSPKPSRTPRPGLPSPCARRASPRAACSSTRRCRRWCRRCCPTRCTVGRTTSARRPCSAWSAPAAWADAGIPHGPVPHAETSSILIAMILLVSLVDFLSYFTRRKLAR